MSRRPLKDHLGCGGEEKNEKERSEKRGVGKIEQRKRGLKWNPETLHDTHFLYSNSYDTHSTAPSPSLNGSTPFLDSATHQSFHSSILVALFDVLEPLQVCSDSCFDSDHQ